LTPILTITQLIRLTQSNLDSRSQEMLEVLESSAKRGADMVKQIMTFARGTDGKRIPLQISYLLQDTVNLAKQTFPKSITVSKVIPKEPLWLVSADPSHLHQILMNLCVNARDAMPEGGALTLAAQNWVIDDITAQKNLDAKPGNYVLVTVSDTGIGIPAELRDRIFEPFFTTKPTGKGTGLGLSTSLGIIKSYGGFLQVFSEVGRGTQIKLYLPVVEGEPTQGKRPKKFRQGNGELVLIVDDEQNVQVANQALLESHGYKTLTASDGLVAISLYAERQREIKLVMIDLMMPRLNGVETMRHLQQINPQVKMIAISGLSSQKQAALAAGAHLFLTKPYTSDHLLSGIDTLIAES
ncbi:MAG TPA: ATP-binding protein, partial [Coleofasciculaceae cyanobacterium]